VAEQDYDLAELFPVNEIPDRLPRRPNGERVSTSTIYFWLGLNRSSGRILRSVQLGRHRFTTEKWLKEFAEGGGPVLAPPARRSPAQCRRAHEAAMKTLEKNGI
jgi:hypothetical protein